MAKNERGKLLPSTNKNSYFSYILNILLQLYNQTLRCVISITC